MAKAADAISVVHRLNVTGGLRLVANPQIPRIRSQKKTKQNANSKFQEWKASIKTLPPNFENNLLLFYTKLLLTQQSIWT